MSSFWLTKRKKAELQDFCQKLGLVYEGYLKTDLETILSEYLDTHEGDLGNDSTFSGYYESQARSPYKKSSSALPFSSDGALIEAPEKRNRRRTSRYVPGESTSNESTPEPASGVLERKTRAGSRALTTRTPRTVRSLRAADVPLSPSPAVVADEIESRANQLVASAKQSLADAEIHQKAISIRDRLSNVVSVNAVSLALEALFLIIALVPISYVVSVPAVSALGVKEPTRIVLPDLFVLLTSGFWSPVLTWLATSVMVPAANAAVFNLVATTVGSKNAKVEEDVHPIDPLSFAVTKALVAYLVHYKGFSFGGLLGEQAVDFVGISVGKELQLVGAGISGLAAIWEGILKK